MPQEQETVKIRKVQDFEGTQFFPVTHVDAVVDSNGDTISTLLSTKQNELVSGTNIKTINSKSILGNGDLVIEEGTPINRTELVVDDTSGTPSGSITLVDGLLTISLTGIKGSSGNSGSSQDYPFELVNNLTEGGVNKGLTAEMGKRLKTELENKFVFLSESEYEMLTTKDPSKIYCTYEDED